MNVRKPSPEKRREIASILKAAYDVASGSDANIDALLRKLDK